MDKIYDLNFGETIEITTICTKDSGEDYSITYLVTRIPGGWLFKREFKESVPVFVPFDNEFQVLKPDNEIFK